MKNLKALKCSAILLLILMSGTGCAENSNREHKRGPQGPPPEAVDACKGKQEGDTVTFTGRQGESLKATCKTVQGKLAAAPEGHMGEKGIPPQGPPPEAVDACKGKQEGDIVTFTGRQGESRKATCKTVQGILAAVPEGHMRK